MTKHSDPPHRHAHSSAPPPGEPAAEWPEHSIGEVAPVDPPPATEVTKRPSPGRIVHVMTLDAKMNPQVRPAIVVRVGDVRADEARKTICVHVFYAPEDGPKHDPLLECAEAVESAGWQPGEWAWPPRA
jgi:hypothetical protein